MSTAAPLTPPPTAPRRDPAPRLWTDAEFARMQQLDLFACRAVELVAGTVVDRHTGADFVFTRKEYYALDDNQFFQNQRVQLIGGVIYKESPMNPPHANAIRKTRRAIERVFGEGYDVSVQLPLDLGLTSEPHPDIAVLIGPIDDLSSQHPTTAVLVVEVSESMVDADTTTKASLYAAGGIADYWVIDLVRDQVVVFRKPRPDAKAAFGADYGEWSAYHRDDKIEPLAAPGARVEVNDLLP